MWQSQAFSGALSLGVSVPVEFDTGWAWLCRPIEEAVAAIATMEAFLMNVRRAVKAFSLLLRRMGPRRATVKARSLGREVFGYHFPGRRRP